MRVGAIDCGTNSIRLLIADASTETVNGRTVTRLNDVVRQMRIVRLGQGVDATGWLAQEALDRTFEATREYAKLLRKHKVKKLRFVATSATRDAGNDSSASSSPVITSGSMPRMSRIPSIKT